MEKHGNQSLTPCAAEAKFNELRDLIPEVEECALEFYPSSKSDLDQECFVSLAKFHYVKNALEYVRSLLHPALRLLLNTKDYLLENISLKHAASNLRKKTRCKTSVVPSNAGLLFMCPPQPE
jgi:hypothetical protein